MQSIASLLVLALVFGMVLVVPVGLLVLFVQMRAKARRAMLEGPWSAVARQFGGRLDGERVLVARDVYQMTLHMQLVSVMQAVGSPYYSDGGTYTEARLYLDPRTDLRIASIDRPHRLSAVQIPAMLHDSPLAHLPPEARVVLAGREARVVFPGAVADPHRIATALAGLQALAERVRAQGPLLAS
jgi:hypothetical protein